MKKYETYKDSGVEWIGEIPNDWVVSKFKLVSEIVTGNTPSTNDENNYTENPNGFVWVKPTYLNDFIPVIDSEQKLTDEGIKNTRKVPKDSVMICCIGNTLGRFGIAGKDLCTNQQINSIVTEPNKLNNSYNKFYASLISSELIKFADFVTLPILTKTGLGEISVVLPPLQEQKFIANYLDQKTTIIDTLLQKTAQKIALLQEQRTAIINQAVTKGLTHLPPAEGGTKGVPMKDSDVEWIGEIPENWVCPKLFYLTSKITDGEHISPKFKEEGIPFLSAKDVLNGGVNLEVKKFVSIEDADKFRKRCNPERGDILIVSRGATIGRTSIVNTDEKFCLLGSVILLKINSKIDSRFIFFLFQNSKLTEDIFLTSGSSAQQAIYLDDIKHLKIPTPTLNEQKVIIEFLTKRTKEIDNLIKQQQKRTHLLKEYRQSLISEVVTGKLCVINEIPVT